MFKTDLSGDRFKMAVLGCRSLVLDKCGINKYMHFVLYKHIITVGPLNNRHFGPSNFGITLLSEIKLYCHGSIGGIECVLYRGVRCMCPLFGGSSKKGSMASCT